MPYCPECGSPVSDEWAAAYKTAKSESREQHRRQAFAEAAKLIRQYAEVYLGPWHDRLRELALQIEARAKEE